MNISDFLRPISQEVIDKFSQAPADSLWAVAEKFTDESRFPFLNNTKIAIVGVDENRGAEKDYNVNNASDNIRKKLYELKFYGNKVQIADIGNIVLGVIVEDTYAALTEIVISLV